MGKQRKMWVAGRLSMTVGIDCGPLGVQWIPCSWVTGMTGAFPAFNKKEDCERFCDGKYPVLEFDVEEAEVH